MTQDRENIDDLLIDLFEAGELSEAAIATVIRNHPDRKEAIVEFVSLWRDRATGDDVAVEPLPPPDLSALWDDNTPTTDPFTGKDPFELKEIAGRCGLPMNLMVKLSERLLQATSIPMLLVRRLSKELDVAPGSLLEFLEQRPVIGASDFRSDSSPVVGEKQSFSDAVRTSSMSPEQKAMWLDLSE